MSGVPKAPAAVTVGFGTVGEAMLIEPTVHPADLTVARARDAFDYSRKRHMLLLVRDGFLAGTLTRDDIAGADPGSPALDHASLDGRTVPPDAPLAFTHETMCERGIRRLAVTDSRGRLLGLLCLKRSRRGFCDDEGVAALRAERASQARIADDRLDRWLFCCFSGSFAIYFDDLASFWCERRG